MPSYSHIPSIVENPFETLPGTNLIAGTSDDDYFIVTQGVGTLTGLLGFDTVEVNGGSTGGVGVNLSDGQLSAMLASGTVFYELKSFENIKAGSASSDFLVGNAAPNHIVTPLFFGDSGDHIEGLGGNDSISAGFGTDIVSGGAGADRINGRHGDDTIFGGADSDAIFGDIGDDVMFGDGGNDILIGGFGHDFMSGGAGNDTFIFDNHHSGDIFIDTGTDTIADFGSGDQIFIPIGLEFGGNHNNPSIGQYTVWEVSPFQIALTWRENNGSYQDVRIGGALSFEEVEEAVHSNVYYVQNQFIGIADASIHLGLGSLASLHDDFYV